MNIYTRTVHLDNHIAEVLTSRARYERSFYIKKYGPRSDWNMSREESYKVRGAECTLSAAASLFRGHFPSESIQELLMTGVKRWEATEEEIERFLHHLPSEINLVLKTPAPASKPKKNRRRDANRFGRRVSNCNETK